MRREWYWRQHNYNEALTKTYSIGFSTISRQIGQFKSSLPTESNSLWKKGFGEIALMCEMIACGEDFFGLPGVYLFFCGRPWWRFRREQTKQSLSVCFSQVAITFLGLYCVSFFWAFLEKLWQGWQYVGGCVLSQSVATLIPNISCRTVWLVMAEYCWSLPVFFNFPRGPPQTRHSLDRAEICCWQWSPIQCSHF